MGGAPPGNGVPRVDLRDPAIDFRFDRAVAFELRSGRHADLDERETAAQIGPARQHAIDGLEPLGNALRVVKPIHSDADDVPRRQPEHLSQPLLLASSPAACTTP